MRHFPRITRNRSAPRLGTDRVPDVGSLRELVGRRWRALSKSRQTLINSLKPQQGQSPGWYSANGLLAAAFKRDGAPAVTRLTLLRQSARDLR
jgi:hypothetical protein